MPEIGSKMPNKDQRTGLLCQKRLNTDVFDFVTTMVPKIIGRLVSDGLNHLSLGALCGEKVAGQNKIRWYYRSYCFDLHRYFLSFTLISQFNTKRLYRRNRGLKGSRERKMA